MKQLIINSLLQALRIILVLLDILINRLFNGRLETISSRAGRGIASGKTWAKVLCKFLDVVDPGHCEKASKNPKGGLK